MDPDDEICKKSCRMYCRNRWNFGRPKFCDAKRIEDALNGLHGDELFNMAIRLMWENQVMLGKDNTIMSWLYSEQ